MTRTHAEPDSFSRWSLIFRKPSRAGRGLPEKAEQQLPFLERIEHELQIIADRAEAASTRASLPSRSAAGSPMRPRTDSRELLCEEREESRRAMERHIVRLHRQLGTGITPQRMVALGRVLTAHGLSCATGSGPSFRDRIEIKVPELLYGRAGDAAWNRLQDLLAQTGLAWPAPDGLSARNPTEELERQRELHIEDVRASFVGTPPRAAAALIHGTVEAWKYAYPRRKSYLWLQTALRGVAAALRAEAFASAVEIWLWRSPELEREILGSVSAQLADAERILETGIHTIGEAADVVARVDEVCARIIPEIVWSHASRSLAKGSWQPWPAAGRTDSKEPTYADPVCGMILPPERVAERIERGSEVFYFCHPSCRRQFEERHQWPIRSSPMLSPPKGDPS